MTNGGGEPRAFIVAFTACVRASAVALTLIFTVGEGSNRMIVDPSREPRQTRQSDTAQALDQDGLSVASKNAMSFFQ